MSLYRIPRRGSRNVFFYWECFDTTGGSFSVSFPLISPRVWNQKACSSLNFGLRDLFGISIDFSIVLQLFVNGWSQCTPFSAPKISARSSFQHTCVSVPSFFNTLVRSKKIVTAIPFPHRVALEWKT